MATSSGTHVQWVLKNSRRKRNHHLQGHRSQTMQTGGTNEGTLRMLSRDET